MSTLSLGLFDAASDAEAARYRVLAALGETRDAFRAFRVAPWLDDLVHVHRGLRALVSGAEAVEGASGPVVDVDWEAGTLVREGLGGPLAVELARWALPRLEAAIGEGRALYEFAAGHALLKAVGVVPAYRDEGFLLVRDGSSVVALRYRLSPLAGPDGAYRALRTSRLDADLDPLAPPAVWKAALALAAPDLPTPAAFCLEADMDLPVDATLLPIAKRKLLGAVGAWGEA